MGQADKCPWRTWRWLGCVCHQEERPQLNGQYVQEIPDASETHKLGSVHFLLSGLPTINWILRHTLLPKSGDHKMIRGHSINLLQLFDVPQKFKVMSHFICTSYSSSATSSSIHSSTLYFNWSLRPWSYQDTTTRRSSLRVDLALCIFCELFGNLLPKGEKNV